MMCSGASAVLTSMVRNLPLWGLMSVMLGVMRGAVMMEVPVKFCASLPVLVRCASALCHTVCVSHKELLVRLLDVRLGEDQDVDAMRLHDRDDAVNLARLHDPCGVPGADS